MERPRQGSHAPDGSLPHTQRELSYNVWMQSLLPIPSAPTDNLYKFLALSGVALMIAGAGFPLMSIRATTDKRLEWLGEAMVLDAEVTTNIENYKRLQADTRQLDALTKWFMELSRDGGAVDSPVTMKDFVEGARRDNAILMKEGSQLAERTDEHVKRNAGLKAKALVLDDLRSDAEWLIKAGGLLFFLGGAISIFGFGRWYTLYQRPMDEQVQAQIDKVRSEKVAPACPSPAAAVATDPEKRLPASGHEKDQTGSSGTTGEG